MVSVRKLQGKRPGEDRRIILKWISKWVWEHELD
jgi:hypothetical protein